MANRHERRFRAKMDRKLLKAVKGGANDPLVDGLTQKIEMLGQEIGQLALHMSDDEAKRKTFDGELSAINARIRNNELTMAQKKQMYQDFTMFLNEIKADTPEVPATSEPHKEEDGPP